MTTFSLLMEKLLQWLSGLSKIKDILTEINEEGKHDRNDGFKTASKASQFDFFD